MVLNTIDMSMQSLADKRLTACLLLIILELFFDGKFNRLVTHFAFHLIHASFYVETLTFHQNNESNLITKNCVNWNISGAETAVSQQEVDRHLELGKQFLVNGQLSDALTHYHAAVGEYFIAFHRTLIESGSMNIFSCGCSNWKKSRWILILFLSFFLFYVFS